MSGASIMISAMRSREFGFGIFISEADHLSNISKLAQIMKVTGITTTWYYKLKTVLTVFRYYIQSFIVCIYWIILVDMPKKGKMD